jgi:hypothetical protein
MWGRLKVNTSETPPWDKLKEAIFWKDAVRYQRVWDLLKGQVKRPQGQFQEGVTTEGGNLGTATFEFHDEGKTVSKVAAWGPIDALIEHRRIHVLLCEVGSDGLPASVEQVFEKHRECAIILVGVEDGMFRALNQLNQMKDKHSMLFQYKTSMMHLFLKEDPPLGSKVSPQVNVARKVFLASPQQLKPHRNYITLDYPWRPSILLHLITILDMPQKNVFLTLLYLPHQVRPHPDVLAKMGQVMSHLAKWQVSFVLAGDTSLLDVTAQLGSVVRAAHSGVEQTEYERQVLSRGLSLNSGNLLQGSHRKSAQQATPTKVKEDDQTETPKKGGSVGRPPSQGSGASPTGKSGKGFKPPRKTGDSQESGSALAERGEKTKARLSAEALEANAEKHAEMEAKKARLSATGATGKGKRSGKGKGTGAKADVDLSDFPDGEE